MLAGIVITKEPVDTYVPLYVREGLTSTQFIMTTLEELGLLKMDFLALKNLTLIDDILNDIAQVHHIDIDFNKIPLADKDTLKLFETANTCGIFQFESNGMRNFLRKLKPNSIDDIIAAIALFRPGAAVNIDSYIKRKHQFIKRRK